MAVGDILRGTEGADTLVGSYADETLYGLGGKDNLSGLEGNDYLDGGTDIDTMIGGEGNDIYSVDNSADVVTESADEGTDLVYSAVNYTLGANVENLILRTVTTALTGTGNNLANSMRGNASANTLDGQNGNDSIFGLAGNDNLIGGAGDDSLDGGVGADTMTGGVGNDSYVVDNASDVVTEDASAGTDTVTTKLDNYVLGNNIENLTLVNPVANGTGNALNNYLMGNSMPNLLTGLDGADTLAGSVGADTLVGGLGDDVYVIEGNDTITELAGEGTDRIESAVTYNLGRTDIAGLANIENLTLTGMMAVNATGNAQNNILIGNDANNTLQGLGGADTISGGQGNDRLLGSDGDDTLNETSDVSGANLLSGDAGNDIIAGGSGNETLQGGQGNDLLLGNYGNDIMRGGPGADSLWGGTGDDTLNISDNGVMQSNDIVLININSNLYDGDDIVSGFVQGTDKISLINVASSSNQLGLTAALTPTNLQTAIANAVTTQETDGNDRILNFDNGTTVTLMDIGHNVTGTDFVGYETPVTYTLSVNTPSITEGNSGTTNLTFNLTLDKAPSSAVTVNYATTTAGTATAGTDFTATTSSVSFAAGQTTASVSIPVTGDTNVELDETVQVSFTGTQLAAPVTGTGTITNDDIPAVTYVLSVNAPTVTEGNSGNTPLNFTLTLDKAATSDVTITYSTLATGTATAGTDFQAASNQIVTIATGATSAQVPISVIGDTTTESSETIAVQFSSAQLSNSPVTGTGTITDDDAAAPTNVSVNAAGSSSAAAGNITFAVTAGTYTYSISNFAAGDQIDFPTGAAPTVDNSDWGDGIVNLVWADGATGGVATISLIGLTTQDSSLNFLSDFTTVFGANTII